MPIHVLPRRPFAAAKAQRRRFAVAAIAIAAVMHTASAESRNRGSVLSLPSVSTEVAAPASILSETPFQKFLVLSCSGDAGSSICTAKVSGLLARERVIVQFVSCIATTTEGGELGNINLAVTDATSTKLFGGHFIAPTFRGGAANQIHLASQPMLLTFNTNQILHVEATPNGGSLTLARCGVSGVKQKLG
jgi:hypothetical protein